MTPSTTYTREGRRAGYIVAAGGCDVYLDGAFWRTVQGEACAQTCCAAHLAEPVNAGPAGRTVNDDSERRWELRRAEFREVTQVDGPL